MMPEPTTDTENRPCLEVATAVYAPGCEERVLLGARLRALLAASFKTPCISMEVHTSTHDVQHDRMLLYKIEWQNEQHLAEFVTSEKSMKNFAIFLPFVAPDSYQVTRWTRDHAFEQIEHSHAKKIEKDDVDRRRTRNRPTYAFSIVALAKIEKVAEYSQYLHILRARALSEAGCLECEVYRGIDENIRNQFLVYGLFESEEKYKEQEARLQNTLFGFDALKMTDGIPRLMTWKKMPEYK